MTDAELVQAALARDPEAWISLVERYLPTVWRYAYALVEDVAVAEDVVGETLLAFVKGIDQLDPQTPQIAAWLRAVVRHKVADHYRRSHRFREHLNHLATEAGPSVGTVQPLDPVVIEENRRQVLHVLDRLPERQRLALEWKYVEGLRVREIAHRLGETEKAVEATLYRARREFRRVFELQESGACPSVAASENG